MTDQTDEPRTLTGALLDALDAEVDLAFERRDPVFLSDTAPDVYLRAERLVEGKVHAVTMIVPRRDVEDGHLALTIDIAVARLTGANRA